MSARSPKYSFWVRDAMTSVQYDGVDRPVVSPCAVLPAWLSWSGIKDQSGAVASSSIGTTEMTSVPSFAGAAPVVCRNPGSARYVGMEIGSSNDFVSDQPSEWGLVVPRVPVQKISGSMDKVDVGNWTVPPGATITDAAYATIENCPMDLSGSPVLPAQTIVLTAPGDRLVRNTTVAFGAYTVSVWARQDPSQAPATYRFVGNPTSPSTTGPTFQPTENWQQFSCQLQTDSYILENVSNPESPVQFAYHQISASVNGTAASASVSQAPQYWQDSASTKPAASLKVLSTVLDTPGYFDIQWAYRPYYGNLATGLSHALLTYGSDVMVGVVEDEFVLYEPNSSTVAASIAATWAPNDIITLRASNLDGLWKLSVYVPGSVQETVYVSGAVPVADDLVLSSVLGSQPSFGSDIIGVNIIR